MADAEIGQFPLGPISAITAPRNNKTAVIQQEMTRRYKILKEYYMRRWGMNENDADAFIYRLAPIPWHNPGHEMNKQIAQDWMDKNNVIKADGEIIEMIYSTLENHKAKQAVNTSPLEQKLLEKHTKNEAISRLEEYIKNKSN